MILLNYHESEITLLSRRKFLDENNGFEIWYSGYDPNTKEKHVVIIKNGMCYENSLTLNPNIVCCRISLERPIYIEADEYLTKEEKDWFISEINSPGNWNKIKEWTNKNIEKFEGIYLEDNNIIMYEGVKPFKDTDQIPDYSLLPTL